MLNVFESYMCPWRHPSNWIPNLKQPFRRLKWAYQRATKGYCDYDVWDIDSWLSEIMHDMLKQLADISNGYPANFVGPQTWKMELRRMADDFKASSAFDNPEGSEAAKNAAIAALKKYYFSLWD